MGKGIVYVYLPQTPYVPRQAEDRAHRIGQTREVLVLVLVSAGTIEEDILDRARQKRDLDAKVIQAGMFNDRRRAQKWAVFVWTIFPYPFFFFGQQMNAHSSAAWVPPALRPASRGRGCEAGAPWPARAAGHAGIVRCVAKGLPACGIKGACCAGAQARAPAARSCWDLL